MEWITRASPCSSTRLEFKMWKRLLGVQLYITRLIQPLPREGSSIKCHDDFTTDLSRLQNPRRTSSNSRAELKSTTKRCGIARFLLSLLYSALANKHPTIQSLETIAKAKSAVQHRKLPEMNAGQCGVCSAAGAMSAVPLYLQSPLSDQPRISACFGASILASRDRCCAERTLNG